MGELSLQNGTGEWHADLRGSVILTQRTRNSQRRSEKHLGSRVCVKEASEVRQMAEMRISEHLARVNEDLQLHVAPK